MDKTKDYIISGKDVELLGFLKTQLYEAMDKPKYRSAEWLREKAKMLEAIIGRLDCYTGEWKDQS